MWRVESGMSEAGSVDDCVVHMVVNTNSKGRELQRAVGLVSLADAERTAQVLNQVNVHSATVIANWLGTYEYLEAYVEEQDKLNKWLDGIEAKDM